MSFYYFASFREANDWLEFDCSEFDSEFFANVWPDQYAEWALLANTWAEHHESKGHDLDGQHGACRS